VDLDDRIGLKTRIGHNGFPEAAGGAHTGDAMRRPAYHLVDSEVTAKITGAETFATVSVGGRRTR